MPKPLRWVLALLLLASAAGADSVMSRSFNVPAGPAALTLKQFSEQAERELMFPAESVSAVRTKAVRGSMTPREALDRMLAATGLTVIQDPTTKALMIKQTSALTAQATASQPTNLKSSPTLMNSSSNRKPPRRWLSALIALYSALSASAQTTTSASSLPLKEEVIELSPFEVRAEKDVGYESLNANSISGLNTSLVNVPVTAEIYNQQFYDDLGISNAADVLLEWASGQSPNGKPTSNITTPGDYVGNTPFTIRGIPAGGPRMDGFLDAALTFLDNTWQERMEVIRGPQSLLYGASGASGIINFQTKQAHFARNRGRVQLRANEWGTFQASMDANVALGSNLALRATLTQGKEEYYTDFNKKELDSWFLAAAYRPFRWMTVRAYGGISNVAKFRGGDSNANVPGDPRSGKNLNLLLAQGLTDGLYFKELDWSNVDSVRGASNIEDYKLPIYGATADMQLAPWLDLRVMGGSTRYDQSGSFKINNSQGVLSPASTNNPTGKWATGGRPAFGQFGTGQKGIRALLNARFDLMKGRIRNNLTIGAEGTRAELNGANDELYYLVDANGDFVVNPANIANNDGGRTQIPITYWNIEDGRPFGPWSTTADEIVLNGNTYRRSLSSRPGTIPPTPTNPLGFNGNRAAQGGPTRQITRARGYFASLYSELFDNRVSLLGGVRRNYQDQWNQDTSRRAVWATTWSAGAVYHINDSLSPYYNYSLSYTPNGAPGGAQTQDGKYPNVNNGVGAELGLKFSIPRWKLNGAVAAYQNKVTDKVVTLFNDTATIDPTSALNGKHKPGNLAYFADSTVRGLETSITANPTQNWRMRLSLSYNSDKSGSRVALQRWYNDEFHTNSAGQVTFGNGAVAMVPSIASDPSSPLIPLTVAMMKDPASGYFADLDTGSGRIRNLGGRSFAALGLTGREDGLTIGTERTGLPITSHQLGWVPPTPEFVVIAGGDRLGIPRSTQSFTVTRTFTEGRLGGFSTGLTIVARQHQLAYYYVDIADGNKRKERILPDQVNTNLMLSYRFKLKSKYKWTTQINITNLMNHRDLVYIRNVGSGVFTNAKMNAVPRSWAWTNTIEF